MFGVWGGGADNAGELPTSAGWRGSSVVHIVGGLCEGKLSHCIPRTSSRSALPFHSCRMEDTWIGLLAAYFGTQCMCSYCMHDPSVDLVVRYTLFLYKHFPQCPLAMLSRSLASPLTAGCAICIFNHSRRSMCLVCRR